MTPTTPRAAVPAQPDALQDFEVRKLSAIGAVGTSSGLVERRPIEYRRELENQFVRGFRAAESRLRAQVATLTAQGAAERAVPADPLNRRFGGCPSCGRADCVAMSCSRVDAAGSAIDKVVGEAVEHLKDWPYLETGHVAADVSKNGLESNMMGGAWTERWHGSGGKSGYEGWSIVNKDGRDLVAYLGRNVESEAVTEIVMAHNNALRASHAQAPAGARSADELARDLKSAIDTSLELRQQLRLMEEHARGEVWRWQVDGANDLATMGNRMGVLIYASDLRNLLAAATPTAQAAPAAEPVHVDKDRLSDWSVNSHMDAINEPVHQTGQEKRTVAVHRAAPAAGAVAGPSDAQIALLDRWMRPQAARELLLQVFALGQTTPAAQADSGVQEDAARPAGFIKPDSATHVYFYEQDCYVLSNFSAFSLEWKGFRFNTSEAAYHWEKFQADDAPYSIRWGIRNANSAHEAYKLAERNKNNRRSDWDDVKVGIMLGILRAKAAQHEYVRRKLLDTGDRILVEDSWRDDFWGWGPNRDGQNMLGKLWMEVRSELRAALAAKGGA